MAGLDLQKQMEEATKERSGIAQALLGIQQSLDKMEPAVSRMEPVLQSLEPVVNDLSEWRPGVDEAVGRLQADLSDIRARLTKMALGTSTTTDKGKATGPFPPATADALPLGQAAMGDDRGQIGHREASSTWASTFGGALLPAPTLANGARDEALMAEVMPDWYTILLCGGLAALLGFSVLLCVMIHDDCRDGAARVLALRGGGDHED